MKKQKIQPTTRPDLLFKEEEYIEKTQKPDFDLSRAERVIRGYKRGLPLESLMRSTGFTPKQIFHLLGLDEVTETQKFQKLTETYEKRQKSW